MLKVTYETYSKILDKTFVNVKFVESMEDFSLFEKSLNLNAKILKVEE